MNFIAKAACAIALAIAAPNTFAQDAAATPAKPAFDAALAKKTGADENGMRRYVLVILKTGPTRMPDGDAHDRAFGNEALRQPPAVIRQVIALVELEGVLEAAHQLGRKIGVARIVEEQAQALGLNYPQLGGERNRHREKGQEGGSEAHFRRVSQKDSEARESPGP